MTTNQIVECVICGGDEQDHSHGNPGRVAVEAVFTASGLVWTLNGGEQLFTLEAQHVLIDVYGYTESEADAAQAQAVRVAKWES